jgi:chloramphenicol-sensitive protein RarD
VTDARTRIGLFMGLTAYAIWGVMPLYFKALASVAPTEIVAHRIIWSLLLLLLLVGIARRWAAIRVAISGAKTATILVATSALIAVNWLVYVYAVVNGHVLEASLGYFLNPLVNVLFGVVLLKERLSRGQIAAVLLAAAGVALLATKASGAIWISLALALSFSSYGFLRKVVPVEALEGLTIESLVLALPALGWIFWLQEQGQGAFLQSRLTDLLLVFGGAVTAIPLLLFTAASKRMAYSTLGFLQYVAPSLQFLLAVFVFGERLTTAHILCFGAIWTALAIFVWEGVRLSRHKARERLPLTP